MIPDPLPDKPPSTDLTDSGDEEQDDRAGDRGGVRHEGLLWFGSFGRTRPYPPDQEHRNSNSTWLFLAIAPVLSIASTTAASGIRSATSRSKSTVSVLPAGSSGTGSS